MRNAYLRPANIDVSVKRLHNFCINKKNKMVISREDRMLIKVLQQERLRNRNYQLNFQTEHLNWYQRCVHCVGNLRFQCLF